METKQLDILDLLIDTIQEHEKVLDDKIAKFETLVDRIEEAIK